MAGSARQLFERRPSEPSSQASMPAIIPKTTHVSAVMEEPAKPAAASEGGSGRAVDPSNLSPFLLHNKQANDSSAGVASLLLVALCWQLPSQAKGCGVTGFKAWTTERVEILKAHNLTCRIASVRLFDIGLDLGRNCSEGMQTCLPASRERKQTHLMSVLHVPVGYQIALDVVHL